LEVLLDVEALNFDGAFGGVFRGGQSFESGRLSRAIHTKKCEAFALLQAER